MSGPTKVAFIAFTLIMVGGGIVIGMAIAVLRMDGEW